MPEPIIEPTTSAVELKRPRLCTNCGARTETSETELGLELEVVT
jgi:transcriptional regulator NrdR family protein